EVIKNNVYPYGTPSITSIDDNRELMVWVDDDKDRNDYNRTALYYSISENNAWSEPKQVNNDGTADFSPEIIKHKDNIYVAWQNTSKKFDDDVTFNEMLKNIQISIAQFDGNKFGEVTNLSNGDSTVVSTPKLASNGSELSVIWIESDDINTDNLNGSGNFVEATLTENNWENPLKMTSADSITGFDTAYSDGERVLAYSSDKDMFILDHENKESQIGKENEFNHSPVLNTFANKTSLYWNTNEGIKSLDMKNNKVTTVLEDSADINYF